MAKKEKIKVKEKHTHKWNVQDETEHYCECEDDCFCNPPVSVYAVCSCGLTLARCEIEDILNKFYK